MGGLLLESSPESSFKERREDGKTETRESEGVPISIFDLRERGFHSVSLVLGKTGFRRYFGFL